MWKPILAGAVALTIAGSSFVFAQNRDEGVARWQPSQEDQAAFADAGIAALKAGLRLTPDQEKNWPAFEAAVRDIVKMHQERFAALRQSELRSDEPGLRLRRHAELMSNAGAALKRLADAQEPLYQSLDDSQKNRFKLLSRVLTRQHRQFAQLGAHGGMMRRDRDGMRDMHERHHGGGMRGGDRMHGGGMMDRMGNQL